MTPVNEAILIIAIIAIVIVVAAALRMRTKKLRSRFGPEYDRAVLERGSALKAERELENREKRVERFHIRPLSSEERARLAQEWRRVQERFVDDPRGSVAAADSLLHQTMKARGYPIDGEFESRVADLSVEHPFVLEHYRAGHQIAVQDSRQAVSTEDLRLAMKHYRALFEDLLGGQVEEVTGARR
jgi:FtsZ-interacting cell division protein ZipA